MSILAKCKIWVRNKKMKATDTQRNNLLELTPPTQAPPPPPQVPPQPTPAQNPEKPKPSQKEQMNEDTSMKNESSTRSQKRVGSSLEQKMSSKRQCKSEKRPDSKVRYCDVKHLPVIDKSTLVRCKKEGCQGKSYVSCSHCKVSLCLNITNNRNCFKDFHEL